MHYHMQDHARRAMCVTKTKTQSNNAFHAHDPAAVRRAIKALNTKKADKVAVRKIPTRGTCEAEARATCEKVDAFLRDLRGTSKCNPEQLAFIETICARVKHEAVSGQERGGAADTNTEALRWALHGGPGTGKSYVLNIARRDLFEECLGWTALHNPVFYNKLTKLDVLLTCYKSGLTSYNQGVTSYNNTSSKYN